MSTSDAISTLTSNIYEALDTSKIIICIFIDLEEAYLTKYF